jgi:hypothetical protein
LNGLLGAASDIYELHRGTCEGVIEEYLDIVKILRGIFYSGFVSPNIVKSTYFFDYLLVVRDQVYN